MPFDDLDMSLGDPELDCVTTLAFFPPDSRRRLLTALREGRLIRHKYRGEDCSQGCVMHMLDETIVSKPTLLSYPFATEEIRLAARRLVRYWDGGVLTDSMLERILLMAEALDDVLEESEPTPPRSPATRRESRRVLVGAC